jgi:hypothetical protein
VAAHDPKGYKEDQMGLKRERKIYSKLKLLNIMGTKGCLLQ